MVIAMPCYVLIVVFWAVTMRCSHHGHTITNWSSISRALSPLGIEYLTSYSIIRTLFCSKSHRLTLIGQVPELQVEILSKVVWHDKIYNNHLPLPDEGVRFNSSATCYVNLPQSQADIYWCLCKVTRPKAAPKIAHKSQTRVCYLCYISCESSLKILRVL